ncbi:MAG: (E)-4-hydroxy-3-methylbut-2-enyl-diphosphate synthase [Planctomycetaceae bacterium]|nr:(E)-4-hydroxy-3-methylbut-2-enyl-diphosphate synthase [Planctomycetaceae bacterium]
MSPATRIIRVGTVKFGGGLPIVLQSMTATKTTDVHRTAETCQRLADAGAGIVRIAVDTQNDANALREIRTKTTANLSVDLQENYRLAETVAPFVDKIRYNPGHLHHAEPELPWQTKVDRIVQIARQYDCALRIGVNCGSLDPLAASPATHLGAAQVGAANAAVNSALQHAEFIDSLEFDRYCVSIKSSDPRAVLRANRQFAARRPDVPIHLGLTEAGLPPTGIEKSRVALEPLLAEGIGDTLRVSLTVPNDRKAEELDAGRLILQNVASGTVADIDAWQPDIVNIVSCPSCARVENEQFISLAEQVRDAVKGVKVPLTIAVMGCRVNGPGETDHADIGLWCGKSLVNLKQGETLIGSFGYDEVIAKMLGLIAAR